MKILRRIMLCMTLLVIIAGMYIAIQFRLSIPRLVVTDDKIIDYGVLRQSHDKDAGELDLPRYYKTTATELLSQSEVIVLAKPTGAREAFRTEILTEVQVLDVLKNERDQPVQKKLLIFEPIFLNHVSEILVMNSAVNIMREEQEYILCLKFFQKPEKYQLNEEEKRMYLLAVPLYGIFPAQELPTQTLIQAPEFTPGDEGYRYPIYRELREYDYLFINESEQKEYFSLRENFFQLLNINDLNES